MHDHTRWGNGAATVHEVVIGRDGIVRPRAGIRQLLRQVYVGRVRVGRCAEEKRVEGEGAAASEGAGGADDARGGTGDAAGWSRRGPGGEGAGFEAAILDDGGVGVAAGCGRG